MPQYARRLAVDVLSCILCFVHGHVQLEKNELSTESHSRLASACSTGGIGSSRILVTGAAGFIGFHASLELRRSSVVVGIDNFNNYYPVSLKLSRASILSSADIPVVPADISNESIMSDIFELCDFTHVLHLAAQPGVRYAFKNPYSYIFSNVLGTVSLLEVIRKRPNKPSLIYASSSSIYGLSKALPFSESDRADSPASLYAATKRSQELITHAYFNSFGISATGLRFFTVYGPWGRPDMAVMSFTRNILGGRPITIFVGPHNETLSRDFTYISDIVAGIVGSVFTSPRSGIGSATHRIFNLGNTRVVGVHDLVNLLQEVIGIAPIVRFISRPTLGEVMTTNADISAAAVAFNFSPQTSIREGLEKFYNWYSMYTASNQSVRADVLAYNPA